jgi:HAD superfamily hydrolase (TIGR01509 family)
MYRAAIFDVDGTLVDSNRAHARAWAEALVEHGHHVEAARVLPLIGMGGDKLLPTLTGIDIDSPEGQAISRRRRDIFQRRYLPELQPTRGARNLLETLRDERVRLLIASSAERDELRQLLRIVGASDLLSDATSSDDAERSKPDPDIVQAALERSGFPAAEVVMVGDTPYDVAAASRAGVGTIALRCGGWTDEALKGAVAIYDDPHDLLEHYAMSPFKHALPLHNER